MTFMQVTHICKNKNIIYEGHSEMVGTHLEYRLRDDDSHTMNLSSCQTGKNLMGPNLPNMADVVGQ
jgi:hypothetical protein